MPTYNEYINEREMEKNDTKVISTTQKILTQESIENMMLKFVVKTMSPISIVENEHFRNLLFSEFFCSLIYISKME